MTSAFLAAGAAIGDNVVTNIQTSQANNEEVRIYAMMVNITDGAGGQISKLTGTDIDFSVQITVGPNNIPSNAFNITGVFASESQMITFPSPILVLLSIPTTSYCNQQPSGGSKQNCQHSTNQRIGSTKGGRNLYGQRLPSFTLRWWRPLKRRDKKNGSTDTRTAKPEKRLS